MYVREIKIRRGIGTWDSPTRIYSYWQVVRSYRDSDTGKVRKQVVVHLGKWKDRKQAETAARAGGALCGVWGCGNPASEVLTWRGYKPGHETPVETTHHGRRVGWRVCPDHLNEFHECQVAGEPSPFRAVPIMLPLWKPKSA
jgi:hypothetical protein